MKYLCSHCGAEWEEEGTPEKCPSCLRKHGILPVEEAGKEHKIEASGSVRRLVSDRRVLGGLAVLVVAAAGVAGLLLFRSHRRARPEPAKHVLGPQPKGALLESLRRAGVTGVELPCQATPSVKKWAKALADSGSVQELGRALADALRSLEAPKGPWKVAGEAGPGVVLVGRRLLSSQGGRAHSFALACLGLAAARSMGLKAAMVEIHETGAVKGPADPTGRSGRFGVALFAKSYSEDRADVVVDPQDPTVPAQATVYTLMDDVMVLGSYLNLKAQESMAEDPVSARTYAEGAAELSPDSATVQCGRGLVLLSLGDVAGGLSALKKSAVLRDDGPRHVCLAQGRLVQRDVQGALSELALAAKKSKDYALAYVLQARIYLAAGQAAKAKELVDRAEEADPNLWELRLLKAQLEAVDGDVSSAEQALKKLSSERPGDSQVFLALWQLYLATGQKDEAQKLQAKFLSKLAPPLRAQLSSQLRSMQKALEKAQAAKGAGGSEGVEAGQGPGGGLEGAGGGAVLGPGPGLPQGPPPSLDFKLKAPTGPSRPADRYRLKF